MRLRPLESFTDNLYLFDIYSKQHLRTFAHQRFEIDKILDPS